MAVPLNQSDPPEKTIFATPENSKFYKKHRYADLDASRQHIRLLKIYHRRLKIEEVKTVYPQWVTNKGTDYARYLEDVARSPPVQNPQATRQPPQPRIEHVSISDPIFDYEFGVRPILPHGWEAVPGTIYCPRHKMRRIRPNGPMNTSLKAWYFVNLYTREATWELPIKPPKEAPPRYPKGIICCELIQEVPLGTATGHYDALSYCAGSARSTREILINGYFFNAFANLEHALDCVIGATSKRYGTKSLTMWTDQVCINQSNHLEKSHQVAMMRTIYETASRVFVVLSSSETAQFKINAANRGFRAMRSEQYATLRDVLSKRGSGLRHSLTNILVPNPQSKRVWEAAADVVELITNMLCSAWWSRAWVCLAQCCLDKHGVLPLTAYPAHGTQVFQEFIVSSRAYFLFGPTELLPWPELSPWIRALDTKFLILLDKTLGPMEKAASAREQGKLASVIIGILKLILGFSHPKISIRNNINSIRKQRHAAMHFAETKDSWQGSSDIRTLLENSYRFSATDQRDLVYAFLGLAAPETRHVLEADYSASSNITHVLIRAAELYLSVQNCLSMFKWAILRKCESNGLRLPSWAPDWTHGIYLRDYKDIVNLISGSPVYFATGRRGASKSTTGVGNSAPKVHWQESSRTRRGSRTRTTSVYATLKVTGFRLGVLTTVIKDNYDWARHYRLGSSCLRNVIVMTAAKSRHGDEVWVLDGATGLFVLRPSREEVIGWNSSPIYTLVHVAGLYFSETHVISPESREIHVSSVEALQRGEYTAGEIYLQ